VEINYSNGGQTLYSSNSYYDRTVNINNNIRYKVICDFSVLIKSIEYFPEYLEIPDSNLYRELCYEDTIYYFDYVPIESDIIWYIEKSLREKYDIVQVKLGKYEIIEEN
jgi:hypothetical protein